MNALHKAILSPADALNSIGALWGRITRTSTHRPVFQALKHLSALEGLGYQISVCNDADTNQDGLFIGLPHFTQPHDMPMLANVYRDRSSVASEQTAYDWLESPQFMGIRIISPTGWTDAEACASILQKPVPLDEEISLGEFASRLAASIVKMPGEPFPKPTCIA